jgi:hypothetical protein
MSVITFASIGAGKQIVINKDEEGYYEIRVGSFNVFNSVGEYYPLTQQVKDILSDSRFTKDLADGKIYSELDHPEFKKGMGVEEYIRRNIEIKPDNLIAHIKEVRLEQTNESSNNGSDRVVACFVKVKPFGTHADILEKSLNTSSINTAFSLRCLYRPRTVGSVVYRDISTIVTWDFVLANGVEKSDKFSTVGREHRFSVDAVKKALSNIEKDNVERTSAGLESNVNMDLLRNIKNGLCDGGKCALDW